MDRDRRYRPFDLRARSERGAELLARMEAAYDKGYSSVHEAVAGVASKAHEEASLIGAFDAVVDSYMKREKNLQGRREAAELLQRRLSLAPRIDMHREG